MSSSCAPTAVKRLETADAVEKRLGCFDNVTVSAGVDDDGDAFVRVVIDTSDLPGNDVDSLTEGLEAICEDHCIQLRLTGEPLSVGFFLTALGRVAGGEWGFADFCADGCAGPSLTTDD